MNPPLLDKVLACPNLPSLPGAAMKVLELTRDPNVAINRIAQTVQADPALCVRVLKTVNSSYYGLTVPCPSIPRAMGMLGLNTVKAIVLGFSLVESTKTAGIADAFDMTGYWRRAVYSAAGARAIALSTRCCDPEEAFIAALLQDIGLLACYAAIRAEYRAAFAQAPDDHDHVAALEHAALGFDHQVAGRQLGERWRLPPQIVECIANHHSPVNAHPSREALVRCVHLGGLAAGALTLADPRAKLGALIVSARDWFKLDPASTRALVQQTATGAAELSKLLEIATGTPPDTTAILAQALEQMAVVNEAVQAEAAQLRRNNDELARQTLTDGLTGAFNRAHYDRTLRTAFDHAKSAASPLAVIFLDADKFKSVNDTHGHQTGDAVLMELAARLAAAIPSSATLCRYGGEEFAVILPGADLPSAAAMAETLRTTIAATPFDLRPRGVNVTLPITISLGAAAIEQANAALVTTPEQITHAADQGVYAAKAAGRNRVCTTSLSTPATPAAAGVGPLPLRNNAGAKVIMIVEDDPLASRLLSFLFSKCKDVRTVVVRTGEEAVAWIGHPTPATPTPDAIISDLNLPVMSGIDLAGVMAKRPDRIPFLIVSATSDAVTQKAAAAAGVAAFIDKVDFCANTDRWVNRVVELMHGQCRAAA